MILSYFSGFIYKKTVFGSFYFLKIGRLTILTKKEIFLIYKLDSLIKLRLMRLNFISNCSWLGTKYNEHTDMHH